MELYKSYWLTLALFLSTPFLVWAQPEDTPKCFWIEFSDKKDSPYSTEAPESFLSPKALARRAKHNIAVTETDLPVNPFYLDSLKALGFKVQYSSRWLNGSALISSPKQITALKQLDFVSSVEYISPYFGEVSPRRYNYKKDSTGMKTESNHYGRSSRNIQMLNGDSLHQMGFQGEGIYIAVLDGGFTNVDQIPFFDSLLERQSTEYFYDFTGPDRQVFESSTHGTSVLSTMAANSPGVLVGTAPGANYLCLKTEEVRGEFRMEEYNWVAALEYADSLGVDIVNSSLGYYVFSDSDMNYTPSQLDGQTSPASRAAGMAFERGMIVVVSAGNEGNNKWKYIDIPADAPQALAIAAVRQDSSQASFSSFGNEEISFIKPDLAAPGVNIPVPNAFKNRLSASSGTSLAAPIMTGLIACLWQAFPDLPNSEIVMALKSSASQAEQPDRKLGYGIPDFMKAYRWLKNRRNERKNESE